MAGKYVEVSYYKIRAKGVPLATSGGKAPGHLGLKAAIEGLRAVILEAQGRRLRPIECFDIICWLSSAVLSGGIRRSATIALFDVTDGEMVYSKCGNNPIRAYANISVVCTDDTVPTRVLDLCKYNGEPGMFWGDNLGRSGCNPCGEIRFSDYQGGFGLCNLVEVVCGPGLRERVALATRLATIQSTYNNLYVHSVGEYRIGVSLTGIQDYNPSAEELSDCRLVVQSENRRIANILGIPASNRTTCVKPSGTASLLLGCSNGIHNHYSPRYIRRIIFNLDEGPATSFWHQNPSNVDIGDGVGRILIPSVGGNADKKYGVDMVDYVREIGLHWLDGNAISCTVECRDETELHAALNLAVEHKMSLTFTVGGLEGKYQHLPKEKVEEGDPRWNALCRDLKPVNYNIPGNQVLAGACEGDRCILRK